MDIRVDTFLKDFKQNAVRPTRSTLTCPVRHAMQVPQAQTHDGHQATGSFRTEAR